MTTLSLSSLVSKILFNFLDNGLEAGTLLLDTFPTLTSAIAVKTVNWFRVVQINSQCRGENQSIKTVSVESTPLLY